MKNILIGFVVFIVQYGIDLFATIPFFDNLSQLDQFLIILSISLFFSFVSSLVDNVNLQKKLAPPALRVRVFHKNKNAHGEITHIIYLQSNPDFMPKFGVVILSDKPDVIYRHIEMKLTFVWNGVPLKNKIIVNPPEENQSWTVISDHFDAKPASLAFAKKDAIVSNSSPLFLHFLTLHFLERPQGAVDIRYEINSKDPVSSSKGMLGIQMLSPDELAPLEQPEVPTIY